MIILWISLKISLAMCLLRGVGYVLVLRGVAAVAGPNGGKADVVTLDGQIVGAANVGQSFTGSAHFWGRPSAVAYNGGGAGGRGGFGLYEPEFASQDAVHGCS